MRVSEVYKRPGPAFSFEFFPPKTEKGLARLYATIEHLAELRPAFVSVTYGAGGSTRDLTVETASHIRNKIGLEAVAHLTCLGHTQDELTQILSQLRDEGVENVLALRGDVPNNHVPIPESFKHANELIGFIKQGHDTCIGAACYPEGHIDSLDPQADLEFVVKKVEAGADFLITQLFFDNAAYFRFVADARAHGVRVPIVPGLMPITSVSQVERFTQMCGTSIPLELRQKLDKVKDDEQAVMAVGIEWAMDQGRELLAGGAPGVHFFTINRSLATRIVCRGLMRW